MDFDKAFNPELVKPKKNKAHQHFEKWAFFVIGLFVLFFGILGSFYTVEPNEVGVVRRFGKYIATTPPGLHFKIPFGIDIVNKVKVDYIFKEEFFGPRSPAKSK